MGTPAQIGKLHFNAILREARESTANQRRILKRLMSEAPNQLIKSLVGQLAIEVSETDSALNQLDEIGKKFKEKRSDR
jgi:hypothetical protein